MRIVAVIGAMGAGGAERAMAALLHHLAPRHDILLMTWEGPERAPFYDLPPSVTLCQTGLLEGGKLVRTWRLAARFPLLRKTVRDFRADVVLSFINTTNITAIAACAGMPVAVVVSERADPGTEPLGGIMRFFRWLLYPQATRLVVQTARAARHFAGTRSHPCVIPNSIEPVEFRAHPDRPNPDGRFQVVFLGRLSSEKQVDKLLVAFRALSARHPDWDLVLLGDGPERAALEEQAGKLDMTGRVRFTGQTRQAHRDLALSHLFVLPSAYEGFPNALGEAMAVGLPAIGFAGVSGVEDLICDGENGFLVGQGQLETTLENALDRLMGDAAARARMGAVGRQRIDRWRPADVLKQWEELLMEAARAR